MPPKWFLIARNEYRIRTSSIRSIRPYFPYLVIGLLVIYVAFITPAIVQLIFDELAAFFLSQIALVTVRIMLFMFFIFFITFPISFAMRDIKTEQQVLFLSAPIKSSDILLGEFLGDLPLYAILVVIITGFFTAVLSSLGLSIPQMILIVGVFVIILSLGLWIGTVTAALLRTKLGESARGKDMGKALSVLIVVPFVGFFYAIIGGRVFEALANPQTNSIVKTMLGVFPSSWGADVVISFASSPGNTAAVWSETLPRLGGLLIFLAAALWIGVKMADRAYNLETTTFTAPRAKPHGTFSRAIKRLGGGGPFGILLASVFKVYGRRFHNLSWLAYVVCIAALINIFIIRTDEPEEVVMMSSFLFSLLAAIVASDVTIRGKETLFIYKKIPSGIGMLVKTRLVQGWLVVIPTVVVIMVISLALGPHAPFLSALSYIGFVIVIATANMAFALGIFLLIPAYTERGGEFILNIFIIVQGSVFLFIGSLIIFGETWGIINVILLSWLLGIVFLLLGKWRLSRAE